MAMGQTCFVQSSRRLPLALALVSLLMILASCGHGGEVTTVAGQGLDYGACALIVEFRGKTYEGHSLAILPLEGESLGTATLPPCDDTPNDEQSEIDVAELPGVSHNVAVLWISGASVLFREDVEPLPSKVSRLLTPPECLEADEPIDMRGRWNGILGADGNTELDLLPQYDVDLLVSTSSAPRYERAFLTVRVQSSLGTPLSEEDVRTSLWQGGTIEITARCARGRYVADHVAAFPPS